MPLCCLDLYAEKIVLIFDLRAMTREVKHAHHLYVASAAHISATMSICAIDHRHARHGTAQNPAQTRVGPSFVSSYD